MFDSHMAHEGCLDPVAQTLCIVPLEVNARFSLRLRGKAELDESSPFILDMPINSCKVSGSLTSARLGPDEWLLLGPASDAARLGQKIENALAGQLFSLVDISSRNIAFAVAGEHAREVINGGCPLDLRDQSFPAGHATRTRFGKAEIILLRPGPELAYRVECWRSFAPYVHALLHHVASEFQSGGSDKAP